MKTVCIYHSVDLDGWVSAAIVKHWFKTTYKDCSLEEDNNVIYDNIKLQDSITFIGYNYGQPIPDLSDYDKVIMCDISFPDSNMGELFGRFGENKNFILLDHHKSIVDSYPNDFSATMKIGDSTKKYLTIEGIRDTNFSACELTWKYFFPNEPMPEIVRLLGLYDSFRHKGTNEEQKVLEFQYGARQIISNYEEAYQWLLKSVADNKFIKEGITETLTNLEEVLNKGKVIYSHLCTEAKQIYKTGFEIELIGGKDITVVHTEKKFICINRERFNPINFGIDYHKDGYDGAACFHYANGMWNFTLYNDNGQVDCSSIAKQYGGGGHKGAAGFRCNNETFLNIIK